MIKVKINPPPLLSVVCVFIDFTNILAVVDDSQKAYQDAFEISKSKMQPTHPIRLGLALNFSVFYYEILNSPDKAYQLAKQVPTVVTLSSNTIQNTSYKFQEMKNTKTFLGQIKLSLFLDNFFPQMND